MLKGINLTLMIGPAVPVPVSPALLDALTGVQVMVTSGETTSGFELTFALDKNSPLHTLFFLTGGAMIPVLRVVIVVTVNGTPEVLMDGVMTHHEIAHGNREGMSTLTVKGKDLTALMGLIDFSGIPYPAMPDFARVALVLAKYAVLGIIPKVVPSVLIDVPIPTDRIPTHKGKDLGYIKELADDVGYSFYLEPGPQPGISFAYWGPELRIGEPQPALNANMDAHSNIDSIDFTFDTESKTLPIVLIQNQLTKVPIPIPIPDITPLSPPLGAIPPIPKNVEILNESAKYSPVQAALIGLAKAAKTADAVTATGTLDVTRYGRTLKARRLVGLRGVGTAFDGLYYVKSITHTIKRGEYKQNFTLVRNGLISTVGSVPA
ncbi:hypothetical protein [Candidatus Nitrospira bockiana]